jgi:hypothetical protein
MSRSVAARRKFAETGQRLECLQAHNPSINRTAPKLRLLCAGHANRQGVESKSIMEPIVTYRGSVYPWHCDHVGHMNVMWYVGKFDETGEVAATTKLKAVYLDTELRKSCAFAEAIAAKAAALLAGK